MAILARLTSHPTRAYLMLIAPIAVTFLWLTVSSPVLADGAVPTGAKEALAPVTKMITTLVAIAIGLGIAICGAVIVWGGIEKTLAGSNQDAEHRSQRRIQNVIHGLVWMILASVLAAQNRSTAAPSPIGIGPKESSEPPDGPKESGEQTGVESGELRMSKPPRRGRRSSSEPHDLVV